MNDLFLVIALLSFVGLVVGLIRPSWVKLSSRKSVLLWFGGAIVVFFVLFGITSDDSKAPAAVVENEQTEQTDANSKTDEQRLEEQMNSTVADAAGDYSYRSLKVEKADSDRPSDSKMLTVTVGVSSIYNRNSFLRDSGSLSAELFKQAFASNLNAYDVFVWYKADTTDRYGNKKDDVITVYHMDKDTFTKVNWDNFDADKLCDFLQQEEKIRGFGNGGPACNVLVEMQ